MRSHANDHSDVGRLKVNANASAQELTEFLRQMRGKSPQEVMGRMAESGLVRSTALAAAATLVLLAAFTAGPYAYNRLAAANPGATAAPNPEPTADRQPPDKPAPAAKAAADPAAPAAARDPVLDKIGETGTKSSSPKVNPLDKATDDLFKEVK